MVQGGSYLKFIDGLRAIAVLGVVLYHFGAGWLPGGFVGVDVFFVISGFLISRSIYQEQQNSRFSILDFYERRARRIVPALIVVTALTSIGAWFVLYPPQLLAYARSVLASLFFVSNIYFFANTDYFATAAAEIPLLHHWSLGIEEQFYLFFPLICSAVHRRALHRLPLILTAIAIASLVASVLVTRAHPSAAFYLLPFRAFELLIGSLLALPGFPRTQSRPLAGFAMSAGVAIILASMVLIDRSIRFPGLLALLPTVGAGLVIWGGAQEGRNATRRLLTTPPMVYIGLISYSLYLVHWPIVVFYRLLVTEWRSTEFLILGTLVSVMLATAVYLAIERPTRFNRAFFSRRMIFAGTIASILASGVLAAIVIAAGGYPKRIKHDLAEVLSYQQYDHAGMFRQGSCFLRPEQLPHEFNEKLCIPEGTDYLIWGNSHLAQLVWGLQPQLHAAGHQLGQITSSGCKVLLNVVSAERPNCRAFNDFALELVLRRKPKTVILGGDYFWTATELDQFDTVVRTLKYNAIDVVILGTVPYYSKSVPLIVADRLQLGILDAYSVNEIIPETKKFDAVVAERYRNDRTITFISVMDTACEGGRCLLRQGNAPLHFDTVHLTREGSIYYAGKLIDPLLSRAEARAVRRPTDGG